MMMEQSEIKLNTENSDFLFKSKPQKSTQELWSSLRKSVRFTTESLKKADCLPYQISHGIHHQRSVDFSYKVLQIIYNLNKECFIQLTEDYIYIYGDDGRFNQKITLKTKILKLLYIESTGYYVALTYNNKLKVINSDFKVVSTTLSLDDIICVHYTGANIVTTGRGYVSIWCFQFAGTYLVQHQYISKGFTSNDILTHMASDYESEKYYIVSGNSIATIDLYEYKLEKFHRNLHIRNITSVLFFQPLKYVITGSRDGSIKLWTQNFDIVLVFVGHVSSITSLCLYPKSSYIMSSSLDKSIRIWSLETKDEVDLMETSRPLLGLETSPLSGTLFTFSLLAVDVWSITYLHHSFTTIGNPVSKLKLVTYRRKGYLNELYQHQLTDRVICTSLDGSVRLLSPISGVILTTLLPHSTVGQLLDATYCLPYEMLVACYNDGSVLRASTTTSPCNITASWKLPVDQHLTCIAFYEYLVNAEEVENTWQQVTDGKHFQNVFKRNEFAYNISLLGGTLDGCLVKVNISKGTLEQRVEAHSSNRVNCIVVNASKDQVVTSGADAIVKVWKIFPNSVEPFSVLTTFYCPHPPVLMSLSNNSLVIGLQHDLTATYTTIIFNLWAKKRFDHEADQDHTNEITSTSCCQRHSLVATSSKDGLICIWDTQNRLIRKLKLNAEPSCVEFCNDRGDILIGLKDRIHIIKHKSYLPKVYILKMICMSFLDVAEEREFTQDQKLLQEMNADQLKKLADAKSCHINLELKKDFKPKRLNLLNQSREKEIDRLVARDNELIRLRDGGMESTKKKSFKVKDETFKNYFNRLYNLPPKVVEIKESIEVEDEKRCCLREATSKFDDSRVAGFFPSVKEAKMMPEAVQKDDLLMNYKDSGPDFNHQGYILNPTSFIPNSILVRLLWPSKDKQEETEESKSVFEKIQLPPITNKQVKKISEEFLKKKNSFLNQMFNPSSLNRPSAGYETEKIIEESVSSSAESEDRVFYMKSDSTESLFNPSIEVKDSSSSFMSKMLRALKTPTPPPEEEEEEALPPTPPPLLPKISQPTKPHRNITKLVTRPRPTRAPKTPETPEFFTQFENESWFRLFGSDVIKDLKAPYSVEDFCQPLLQLLFTDSIDFEHKIEICNALRLLWLQEQQIADQLCEAIQKLLKASNAPKPQIAEQRAFLQAVTSLFRTINKNTNEVVVELLTQLLQATEETHVSFVRGQLTRLGLQDSNNNLEKELNQLESWETDLKEELRNIILDWISKWKNNFQNHLKQTIKDLKSGKQLKGHIRLLGNTRQRNGFKADISTNQLDTKQEIELIEVLNYFCEIKSEEEMEKLRLKQQKSKTFNKTVLACPNKEYQPALIRLGEMHTSRRNRSKKELSVEYRVPPLRPYPDIYAPFTNKLKLGYSFVHLNSTLSNECDRFDRLSCLYQPILITLKNPIHQRYFVHEKSYVHFK